MSLIESLESRTLLSMTMPHTGGHTPGPPSASIHHQPNPKVSVRRMEIRFMTRMIDHHFMAVMMGEMAVDKAVHTELKTLGENIVATQTAEIEQMQTWLKDWYGIDYVPKLTKGEQRQMNKLDALTGSDFEIAFLKQMIPHHQMAVMMSRPIAQKASHAELRDLANDIITTQTAEIKQMQTWLKDWYGITSAGHHGGMGGAMH